MEENKKLTELEIAESFLRAIQRADEKEAAQKAAKEQAYKAKREEYIKRYEEEQEFQRRFATDPEFKEAHIEKIRRMMYIGGKEE